MFNHSIQFSRNSRNDFAIKIFISVLFLCLVCPIRFKIQSAVPITLQSLAVLLVAIWFGWRIGVSAILLYIFLGAVGFHVFADYKSGVEKLWGPTGGFFWGFLVVGYYAGTSVEKIKFQKPVWNLLLWFAGHAIIIFIGVVWYSCFNNDWFLMLKTILPGAIIKSFAGWLLTLLLLQLISRRKLS